MNGHLECFKNECFWINDDPWLPWSDIYLCRKGDKLRLRSGELAGEIVTFTTINGRAKLKGKDFTLNVYNKMKIEWIRGGNTCDY